MMSRSGRFEAGKYMLGESINDLEGFGETPAGRTVKRKEYSLAQICPLVICLSIIYVISVQYYPIHLMVADDILSAGTNYRGAFLGGEKISIIAKRPLSTGAQTFGNSTTRLSSSERRVEDVFPLHAILTE